MLRAKLSSSLGVAGALERWYSSTVRASDCSFSDDVMGIVDRRWLCEERRQGAYGASVHRYDLMNRMKVYISSRSAKDCDETAKELNELGSGTCIAIPADMQKLSEVERLVKELSSKEKALHVLVNNAGAAWGDGIDEYPVHKSAPVIGSSIYISWLRIGLCFHEASDPQPPKSLHSYPEMPSSIEGCCTRGGEGGLVMEGSSAHYKCSFFLGNCIHNISNMKSRLAL